MGHGHGHGSHWALTDQQARLHRCHMDGNGDHSLGSGGSRLVRPRVHDPSQDWDGVAGLALLDPMVRSRDSRLLRGCPGGWTGAYAAATLDVRDPAWFGFDSCVERAGRLRGLRGAKLREGRLCVVGRVRRGRGRHGASLAGARQSRTAGSLQGECGPTLSCPRPRTRPRRPRRPSLLHSNTPLGFQTGPGHQTSLRRCSYTRRPCGC